jgi:integrase
VRDVILESFDDYRRGFETLDRMERERQLRSAVADAIRVIALTGTRRGEIVGLCWSHVDLKRGLIILPARSHKTGKRTGKARIIGLPAAAQAIIARQKLAPLAPVLRGSTPRFACAKPI